MRRALGFTGILALGVAATAAQADLVPRSAWIGQEASLAGPSSGPSARVGSPYSTGFNTGQGYTAGWLDVQQGWQTFPSVQSGTAASKRPEVVGTIAGAGGSAPFEGDQQLRLRKRTASSSGTAVGGAKSLASAFTAGETVIFSVQTKITANDGADYLIELADATAGTITARVGFDYLPGRQAIYVFDDDGLGGFETTDTGVAWTTNVWKELRIEQTLGGAIKYYYDNVMIYNDVNGIPGTSTTMNEIAIYSDNFQLSESGYFDAVSVTPEPASLALLALGALSAARRRR